VFRIPVRVVTVPTAVFSPAGQFIGGLQPHEFRLFDNDRSQNVHLEYVQAPLSLAIVVQANDAVRAWLPEVRRVANVVDAMLLGATGEASVTTFGDDLKTLQPFSADAVLLGKSFASISARGDRSRCLDAVLAAAKLLAAVPLNRRRVILLIGQSGDVGSTAPLRDVLGQLERDNIVLHSLVMPRVGKDLIKNTVSIGSTNGAFGRSDTGIMGSVDLGKLIPEILRGEKTASSQDEVTVLTSELGGDEFRFASSAISKMESQESESNFTPIIFLAMHQTVPPPAIIGFVCRSIARIRSSAPGPATTYLKPTHRNKQLGSPRWPPIMTACRRCPSKSLVPALKETAFASSGPLSVLGDPQWTITGLFGPKVNTAPLVAGVRRPDISEGRFSAK
jgi:hypothetical protein